MPGLSLSTDTISNQQGRENGQFMLGVTISLKSQLLHSQLRVFLALPPISSRTNPVFSCNLEISLAQPCHCQGAHRDHPVLPGKDAEHPCPAHTRVGVWRGHSTKQSSARRLRVGKLEIYKGLELRSCIWHLACACRILLC